MQIEKHDKSYIVKLEDGSSWRIWPGDIALTLGWSSMTVFEVSEIDDEFCSHALVDKTDGSRVRVIEASKDWPVQRSPAIHEERLIMKEAATEATSKRYLNATDLTTSLAPHDHFQTAWPQPSPRIR